MSGGVGRGVWRSRRNVPRRARAEAPSADERDAERILLSTFPETCRSRSGSSPVASRIPARAAVPTAPLRPPRARAPPRRGPPARRPVPRGARWDGQRRAARRASRPRRPTRSRGSPRRRRPRPAPGLERPRRRRGARGRRGGARRSTPTTWRRPAAVDAALALLPPGARLYGTARFDPAAALAPEWAAFGRVRFVLPRAELVVAERRARPRGPRGPRRAPRRPSSPTSRASCRAPAAAPPALPLRAARGRTARAAPAGRAAVRDALAAFAAGALGKVVLARRADLTFDAPGRRRRAAAPPRAGRAALLLRPRRPRRRRRGRLRLRPRPSASSALEPTPTACAASPTEAVAGTRPRAADDAADDALLGELMDSDKDRREHAFVRDAIAERLAPLATSVTVDAHGGRDDARPRPPPPHGHRGHARAGGDGPRRAPRAPPDAGRRRDAARGGAARHRAGRALRPRPLRRAPSAGSGATPTAARPPSSPSASGPRSSAAARVSLYSGAGHRRGQRPRAPSGPRSRASWPTSRGCSARRPSAVAA